PRRFLLWVDGIGTFLVLRSERVGIGRAGSSAQPDIELPADLEGVHAQILRVDHDYFLVAHGPVTVRGSAVNRHLLGDRDEFVLSKRSRLRFHLPSGLSTTAMIDLGSQRLEGDVRRVILLDGHLIFGSGDTQEKVACHLNVPKLKDRIILSFENDQFYCRTQADVTVGGKSHSADDAIPFDEQVQAGELAFTLTILEGGRA
ncbi:MAG: hypothetical protein AAF517_23950, partial [Planctomycetota bacterium]